MTQRLHRRLLAAGLLAGVTTVGLTTGARAATTVDTGDRRTVGTTAVSPAALPVTPGSAPTAAVGAERRTRTVTVTL
ncbi:hypothetical protein [Kineococcus aurantiacus]|uniref:Uncharacterized protein n=1 Tax=Kineococcus aurantiacus TaxID=37633 RepID=A0A7Y9ART7_9ACTN|nr:hypothetical protein [Kineococcus aurantiacus]NYD20840.1 hypothetical protein [Kineococcus aurantiacus]